MALRPCAPTAILGLLWHSADDSCDDSLYEQSRLVPDTRGRERRGFPRLCTEINDYERTSWNWWFPRHCVLRAAVLTADSPAGAPPLWRNWQRQRLRLQMQHACSRAKCILTHTAQTAHLEPWRRGRHPWGTSGSGQVACGRTARHSLSG